MRKNFLTIKVTTANTPSGLFSSNSNFVSQELYYNAAPESMRSQSREKPQISFSKLTGDKKITETTEEKKFEFTSPVSFYISGVSDNVASIMNELMDNGFLGSKIRTFEIINHFVYGEETYFLATRIATQSEDRLRWLTPKDGEDFTEALTRETRTYLSQYFEESELVDFELIPDFDSDSVKTEKIFISSDVFVITSNIPIKVIATPKVKYALCALGFGKLQNKGFGFAHPVKNYVQKTKVNENNFGEKIKFVSPGISTKEQDNEITFESLG